MKHATIVRLVVFNERDKRVQKMQFLVKFENSLKFYVKFIKKMF